MGTGLSQCQCLGAAHGTHPPAPLQLPGLPLTPVPGAVLELKVGLLLLQGLQVGLQWLKDCPIVPPPPEQAEGERLSLQSLQHGPSLEGGGSRGEQGAGEGGTPQPSVPTHLPREGVSQCATIDVIEDVTGQHHLVHLCLALGEHLGDKDSAIQVPGGAVEPQFSPRDPAWLRFCTIHNISPIHGMQGKAPLGQQILARLS